MSRMNLYYVVLWDFSREETGDVVKDGVVFSDVKAAKAEATERLILSISSDLGSSVKPILSRRLGESGYVTGDIIVKAVSANDAAAALKDALSGKGEEVDD